MRAEIIVVGIENRPFSLSNWSFTGRFGDDPLRFELLGLQNTD